jgi:hypothetical protein
MSKNLTILLVAIGLLVLVGGGFWLIKGKGGDGRATPTPTPEKIITEVPLAERPYVSLTPRADGRELTLNITNIKNASSLEYELSYLSNDLSRGVIGTVDVGGSDKLTRQLLLGSCSKNTCKYDENVTEGSLTLRFRGSVGTEKFTADFHLQKGGMELSSLDGYFKAAAKLPVGTYFITMSTIGLPSPIEGTVLGQPYGIFSSGTQTLKPTTAATLTPNGNTTGFQVYFWDGKTWQMKPNNLLGVFVAVTE